MDPTTAVVLLVIVANVVVWQLINRRRGRLSLRLPPRRRRWLFGSLHVIAVLLLVGSGIIAQACLTTDTGGGVNFAEGGNGRDLDTEFLWRSGLIGGRH